MMWYVYILKCKNGKPYVGCTGNLKERLKRHHAGRVYYTRTRLPVELLFYCAFPDKYKAFFFEKYLKSGSGRAFTKRRLI
jgi:predicted GIY-YIG superfamily endonuclease